MWIWACVFACGCFRWKVGRMANESAGPIYLVGEQLYFFFQCIHSNSEIPLQFLGLLRHFRTVDVFVVHYIQSCYIACNCWMSFDRKSQGNGKRVWGLKTEWAECKEFGASWTFCLVFDTDTISMLNENETTRETFYRNFHRHQKMCLVPPPFLKPRALTADATSQKPKTFSIKALMPTVDVSAAFHRCIRFGVFFYFP